MLMSSAVTVTVVVGLVSASRVLKAFCISVAILFYILRIIMFLFETVETDKYWKLDSKWSGNNLAYFIATHCIIIACKYK